MSHLKRVNAIGLLVCVACAHAADQALMGTDSGANVSANALVEEGSSRPVITHSTSDIRAGVCGNIGTMTRSYTSGGTESGNSSYAEYGGWLSYTHTLKDTWPSWRWEVHALTSTASIQGNNAEGSMRSWMGGCGLGYAPNFLSGWDGHLQMELMPFIGAGAVRYKNTFSQTTGGNMYRSDITSTGTAFDVGLKLNILWILSSGWEFAGQIGYVEKHASHSGDIRSETSGIVLTGPFEATDTLRGLCYGLFVGYRL